VVKHQETHPGLDAKYKKCLDCYAMQPISFFRKRTASKDGLNIYCKTCHSARVKDWRTKNPERVKANRQRYKPISQKRNRNLEYGLSDEQYLELLASQDGCCLICGLNNKRLVIDHCHKTGIVRGILCHSCNSGIGMLQDDPEIIKMALWYLELTSHEA
jgi:hypothetical protein